MDLSVRPVRYGYKSTPLFKIITKSYDYFGVWVADLCLPADVRTLSFIKFSTNHNNTYLFDGYLTLFRLFKTSYPPEIDASSFSICDRPNLSMNRPNSNGLDNIILKKQNSKDAGCKGTGCKDTGCNGYLTTPFFG